jgi:FkbM family methyltransferase
MFSVIGVCLLFLHCQIYGTTGGEGDVALDASALEDALMEIGDDDQPDDAKGMSAADRVLKHETKKDSGSNDLRERYEKAAIEKERQSEGIEQTPAGSPAAMEHASNVAAPTATLKPEPNEQEHNMASPAVPPGDVDDRICPIETVDDEHLEQLNGVPIDNNDTRMAEESKLIDSGQLPNEESSVDNKTPLSKTPSSGAHDDGKPVVDNGGMDMVDAPAYRKLVPIPGWDRNSGDSARSISEWSRWWRYLRLPENRPFVLMKWINGLTLAVYRKNEIFRAIFVRGIYDPNSLVVINAFLKKGSVFMDVGASMGYCSLLVAKTVGVEGKIFALEPSSRDFNRLVENIRINKLDDVISASRVAVSDVSGSTDLLVAAEERGALNTLGKEFGLKGVETDKVEVIETTTIDAFVRDKGIAKIAFIKLDVEGSELKALLGAKRTIEHHRPVIMLGINENSLAACGAGRAEIQKILNSFGYQAYKIVESPKFALRKVQDFIKDRSSVVFCLPDGLVPPELPQPENLSILDKLKAFFN